MANFRPIEVTQDNTEYAIRENILEIFRVLDTKLRVDKSLPMNELNANGNLIRLVGEGQDDHSACTYQQFLDLLNE